jgi:catechol 2,3-dioxygenase-like lactoylglutathione lyase family enzyme
MAPQLPLRCLAALILSGLACQAQDLPLTGISHVNFRVSDMEKARAFYTGLLGYPQAFSTGRNGAVGTAYLKVNDEQYIEISPGLKEGMDQRLTHVSFVTTDIEKLHAALTARGLEPTPLRPPGGDGTRGIRIADPFSFPLEFTEYLPASEHAKARGKFEGPGRISTHLLHAGIPVPREKLEVAVAFYRDKLGFTEFWRGGAKDGEIDWINLRTPGARGDYIELMLYDGTPSRSELGVMEHVALEVADIQKAYQTMVSRGAPPDQSKPKIGRNGKWQLNLFDPDGSRTELMEAQAAKK